MSLTLDPLRTTTPGVDPNAEVRKGFLPHPKIFKFFRSFPPFLSRSDLLTVYLSDSAVLPQRRNGPLVQYLRGFNFPSPLSKFHG